MSVLTGSLFFLLFSFGLLAYVMTSAFEDCLTLG